MAFGGTPLNTLVLILHNFWLDTMICPFTHFALTLLKKNTCKLV